MASPLTHAIVALSLGTAWSCPRQAWSVLVLGVMCAEIPDLDVIGFWFGVPYMDIRSAIADSPIHFCLRDGWRERSSDLVFQGMSGEAVEGGCGCIFSLPPPRMDCAMP